MSAKKNRVEFNLWLWIWRVVAVVAAITFTVHRPEPWPVVYLVALVAPDRART